ncbi:hypothetical protein [[Limnothrix rosea] IAM M-220]|uniref:hypothetical protein n=1 Tax=[Limnothrix rosea] IAM M-220 TaxID=454133 RepID=UPI000969664F|nr:hypothetical protein [[Limnothrix rosea] IAM M-220]OKH14679.1 hypothetical protein NIES208_13580 [[Limnothrix rosea] IAM M-220]
MNDDQLTKSIQSMGMGCFVKYFEAFSDLSKSNQDLVEALMKIEGYTENGSRTRVSRARQIIDKNFAMDALKIIIESKKTEPWIRAKAQYLIEKT